MVALGSGKSQKEGPVSILLVEDNETDVKIILRAFDKAKLLSNVFVVADGFQALDFLKRQGRYEGRESKSPDIILLDINLPRMDGRQFMREFRLLKEFNQIPVIVFTTKEGMEDIFKVEGATDYVMKSLDALDLIKKIRKHTQSRQH